MCYSDSFLYGYFIGGLRWGESRESYATTAYFDLEKCGWRSFRWENLIAVF
ncbi:SH3 beta-barrel fold-containing protein [Bacteroides uniformis]|uniref:SH3 beta-barrel fold-containing protein n=1 Tax=Bacteroides uniformis TaxID=820 RepID=UPI0009B6D7EB|nr:SH3 beta-barrel fold-containing protein [Bacteroides uniformis]